MELRNLSVRLNVRNLQASKDFYESLGFEIFDGDQSKKWLIMKNDVHTVGLFQDLFEMNNLVFEDDFESHS